MFNAALIVAAGRGARARAAASASGGGADISRQPDIPKQYAKIGAEAVLTHTLRAFICHPLIASVQVVIHGDDRAHYDKVLTVLAQTLPGPTALKLRPAAIGGKTRQQSVRNGLAALQVPGQVAGGQAAGGPTAGAAEPELVLVHDAARPFVPAALITAIISALQGHCAAIAALPLNDTLKRAGPGDMVQATIERAGLWRAQTPQGFRFCDLLAAHAAARDAGLEEFTDDAALAEWAGLAVKLIEGAAANIKLTTPEDLALASRDATQREMAGRGGVAPVVSDLPANPNIPTSSDLPTEPSRPDIRTGNGFDVHRFCAGNHVWLCGIKIVHDKALAGHSDADVGLHALTDAILGALADGDIGAHFPPTDRQWKNAVSAKFLKFAADRVAARGGIINHVDVTILCETPQIGPHRDAMRTAMASILNIDKDRVALKATTTEGLGFTGRGEGIAAMATATVLLPAGKSGVLRPQAV